MTTAERRRTAGPGLLLALGWALAVDAGEPPATFVYRCPDDQRFVARLANDQAWLFLPGETLRLARHPGQPGTRRYAAAAVELLSRGDRARLTLADRRRLDCDNDRRAAVWEHAKLNGVDFRAVGNEPGWQLEIRDGASLDLVSDYGARRLHFPLPRRTPLRPGPGTRYRASGTAGTLEVILTPGPCQDSMADERYPTRVELELAGVRYRGCGRPLH